MKAAGQKPMIPPQGRLQHPSPSGRATEPDTSRLAYEFSDLAGLKLPINIIDTQVQFNASAPAKVFQPDRESRLRSTLYAIEEMYLALRATRGGQPFQACQKRSHSNATGNPDLLFGNIAKIKAAIGPFDRYRITDIHSSSQLARVVAQWLDGETQEGSGLPFRGNGEWMWPLFSIQRQ